MHAIRLGLIADSSIPTSSSLLPYDAIENAFRNVDAILHAGTITSADTLDYLSGIAPTQAVYGGIGAVDNLNLPEKRILQFGTVRVGLIHGLRHPILERYFRLQHKLGNLYAGGRHLLNDLPQRFVDEDVDVIVFGHLQTPLTVERDGVLLINPGVVHTIPAERAQWELLHERDEHRRQILEAHIKNKRDAVLSSRQPRSTVGILEIAPNKSVRTHIQRLPMLAYH